MSRRASAEGGSLELLLDTICNTFGGVLFISMLVVTLLNMTSEAVEESPPNQMTQLELIEAELAREKATNELDRLRQVVSEQDAISGVVASAETIRKARAVQDGQQEHARLVSQKSNAIGQTSNRQMNLNGLKKQAEERKSKLEAANKQAAALKKKLDDTVDQRSKQAVIPKVSRTSLSRSTFFLTGGKLYGPRFFPGGANNTADFVETSKGGTTYIDPNPSGGVIVDPSGKNLVPVINKLGSVSSSSFYIKLYVWPDSFEHCEAVQKAMESTGLKSDRTPLEAGTRIIIGGVKQGPSFVQP